MIGSRVDLELTQGLPAQRVLRQHAPDGLLDHALGVGVHQFAIADRAQATGVPRMPVGALALQLVTAQRHLVGVDDDHEVTGVHVRREDRLVLAAQQDRRMAGQPAENDTGRVNNVPLPRDVTALGAVRAHSRAFRMWDFRSVPAPRRSSAEEIRRTGRVRGAYARTGCTDDTGKRACSQHMDANAKNTRCRACLAKRREHPARQRSAPPGNRRLAAKCRDHLAGAADGDNLIFMGHRGKNGSRTPGHAGSGAPGSDDESEWTAAWHDDSPWQGDQEWRDAPGDGYADDAWYDADDGSRGPAQGYPPGPDQPDPVYPQGGAWSGSDDPGASGGYPAWDAPGTGPAGLHQVETGEWDAPGTGPAGPHQVETGEWAGSHWDRPDGGEWDADAPHTGQFDANQIAGWDGGQTGEWSGTQSGHWAGTEADHTDAGWDADVPHTGQFDANQIAQWGEQSAHWDAAEGHWVEPGAPGGYDEDYPEEQDPGADRAGRGKNRRRRRRPVAAAAAPEAAPPAGPRQRTKRSGRPRRTGRTAGGGSRNRTIILAAAGAVIVAALGVTAYTFLGGRGAKTNGGPNAAAGPKLPTTQPSALATSGTSKLGKWGHISSRATDKTPLSLDETFPAQFLINGLSLVRTADRSDTDCTNALFGSSLQNSAKANDCSQVVRASYMSADQKMMGTIGVVNLATSNGAAKVGQASGPNDFVTPLVSKTGPTRDLDKGTGVVQAEYKGHYLILIWAEYANLKAPSNAAARRQLDQFSADLISGSANIALSNRMVSGRRVADLLQAQAMRGRDVDRVVTDRGGQQPARPVRAVAALAHREQRPDQGADHVVAERVGDHGGHDHAVAVPGPVEPEQFPYGGRALAAAAEGREVVLADQGRRGLVHPVQADRARVPQRLVPAQRVGRRGIVAHPVPVPPPERGEPRVEPVRGGGDAARPDVGRQRPGQPPRRDARGGRPGGRGHVDVRDLPAGVHAGIGTPGHGQLRGLRQPQDPPQRRLGDLLHRAPAGLCRPPGKFRPVVSQVQPQPYERPPDVIHWACSIRGST